MKAAMTARARTLATAAVIAATALVANAYLFTGEGKYADWVKDYVGAWLDRTRQNGGITPDNIGLSGKAGEYQNGKWWGGQYGWHWPHGYYSVGMALEIGAPRRCSSRAETAISWSSRAPTWIRSSPWERR